MRNEPMRPDKIEPPAPADRRRCRNNLLPASEGLRLANGAQRCGARTRGGAACRAPAIKGRQRCRMHGGSAGSGAQAGNSNALKHGCFTAEALEMRKTVAELVRMARGLG